MNTNFNPDQSFIFNRDSIFNLTEQNETRYLNGKIPSLWEAYQGISNFFSNLVYKIGSNRLQQFEIVYYTPFELQNTLQQRYNKAAQCIQSTWHKLKAFKQRNQAVLTIQRVFRGYSSRKSSKEFKKESKHYVDYSTFKKCNEGYLYNPSTTLAKLPRASNGQAPVFFPPDINVVFKYPSHFSLEERFKQIQQAREVCEKNQYQFLSIPKARVFEANGIKNKILVETRLPIKVQDRREQIDLYMSCTEKFTKAIEEYTHFCLTNQVSDLAGLRGNDLFATLAKVERTAYFDNVALFTEKNQHEVAYRIGLVDLEWFKPNNPHKTSNLIFSILIDLIHLFPLHKDSILATAQQVIAENQGKDSRWQELKGLIEAQKDQIDRTQQQVLDFIKFIYLDHLNFLREKGITVSTNSLVRACDQDMAQLTTLFELESLNLDKNIEGLSRFFDAEQINEELLSKLQKYFPGFCKVFIEKINQKMEQNFKKFQVDQATNADLLISRTLQFNSRDFQEMDNFCTQNELPDGSCGFLFREGMKLLVQQKIISYYDAEGYTMLAFC